MYVHNMIEPSRCHEARYEQSCPTQFSLWHKPVLKASGKSDCAVQVVGLSFGATPSPGKILYGVPSQIISDKAIIYGRPKMGNISQRMDISSKTKIPLNKLYQWAVRKTAFAGAKQDGGRLFKQIFKQLEFQHACRADSALACLSTPEVYSVRIEVEERVVVDMEYVPFPDTISFFKVADQASIDWFAESIAALINFNLRLSSNVPLVSLVPDFQKKAHSIIESMKSSATLTSEEVEEATSYLNVTLAYHFAHHSQVLIPVGLCHGDLTFGNMLVDNISHNISTFDFLDCFIESPLQDLAKLLQDCRHFWIFTQVDIEGSNHDTIRNILNYLKGRLRDTYIDCAFWPVVRLFEMFCLVRVLPYTTTLCEKQCIFDGIRRICENDDAYHSSLPN